MKERDEIAELFKNGLEHHTEPVNPAVWAKLQSGLASKAIVGAAATSNVAGIIKVIAVASLLVGSAIGVGAWLQRPEKRDNTTSGNVNITDDTYKRSDAEIPEVKPIESPKQISEVDKDKSTGLAINQTDISTKNANEESASLTITESPGIQTAQNPNNTSIDSPEASVSASPKSIDSKNNAKQSALESPYSTKEKYHKTLLTSDIPNIFTPNGDGKNDLFNIPVAENVTHTTKVFSQKGELITEFTQTSDGWDGTKTGGIEAANGTYFYVTFVSDQVGNQKQIKGTINLVR